MSKSNTPLRSNNQPPSGINSSGTLSGETPGEPNPLITSSSVSVMSDQPALVSAPDDEPTNFSDVNTRISITFERVQPGADHNRPMFLQQHLGDIADEDRYTNIVLPYIASCTFEIASTLDINFMVAMLKSDSLPGMHKVVTKLAYPRFYWFSGVSNNRKSCPSLAFAASLPAVQELSITFHTAGLTTSAYNERERIRLEATDLEKSKQLRVLRLDDVVKRYDLARIFDCPRLTHVHLECINSEMVVFFARAADPLGPFRDLVHWIQRGYFDTHHHQIAVTSSVKNIRD